MGREKPIILILTTHMGGGHMNLAQSLKEQLETEYTIVISDPQSSLVERWYSFVSRSWVHFLTWQYQYTDNSFASFWLQRISTLLSVQGIFNIIEHIQPQLIITTHALLSYATARACERLQKHIPLVFQLTDLAEVHMTWFTEKYADAYLVPTQEIFAQAVTQGIERHRLHLTGRPVRRQFLTTSEIFPEDRSKTLLSLGLDPAIFTIFLQGGAKGSGRAHQTIKHLLSLDMPLQIILAVGNNLHMGTLYPGKKQIAILPFTAHISPYMQAADIIIGKAGASFITEAFMVEKPFVVTTFIPGQETPNLRFIEQHNLGWICLDPLSLQQLLLRIATDPQMVTEKVQAIRAYKTWNQQQNRQIRTIIEQLLFQRINNKIPG